MTADGGHARRRSSQSAFRLKYTDPADVSGADLKAGDLVFHCNTCEANWPPSKEEISQIREQFGDNT
jgi:hypothetical protein